VVVVAGPSKGFEKLLVHLNIKILLEKRFSGNDNDSFFSGKMGENMEGNYLKNRINCCAPIRVRRHTHRGLVSSLVSLPRCVLIWPLPSTSQTSFSYQLFSFSL
jgi:hypothetical protein